MRALYTCGRADLHDARSAHTPLRCPPWRSLPLGRRSFVLGLALPALLVLRAHRSGRPLIGRSRHWLLRALGGRVSAYCVLLIALLSTVLSLLNATGVALR